MPLRQLLQHLDRRVGRDLLLDPGGQSGVDTQPGPLSVQVDDSCGRLDLARAEHVGGVQDDLLHHSGDGPLVAPGLVDLEHRELGAVGGVDALVAEDAAHLVHALHAADDRSLQEQLEGDPERHRGVERVQVRAERAGVGATVHQLQHRGLDLDVVVAVQGLPDAPGDRGPGPDHVPRGLADGQVGVALADPVLVRQLVVQGRQRTQRLGRQRPLGREHRELTAAGGDDPTGHADEVTQVDVGLPVRQGLLADLGQRQHHLQPGAGVGERQPFLQRREAQLAGVPDEHHPPGDRDDVLGLLTGLQLRPARAHVAQGVRPRDGHRVGLTLSRQQLGALVPTDPDLLGNVRGGGRLVGHRPRVVERPPPAGEFPGTPAANGSHRPARVLASPPPQDLHFAGVGTPAECRIFRFSGLRGATENRGRRLPRGNEGFSTLHPWRTSSRVTKRVPRSTR